MSAARKVRVADTQNTRADQHIFINNIFGRGLRHQDRAYLKSQTSGHTQIDIIHTTHRVLYTVSCTAEDRIGMPKYFTCLKFCNTQSGSEKSLHFRCIHRVYE